MANRFIRLETWSRLSLALICLCLVGTVAGADYLTGYETGFSIFYLSAVFIAAWYLGFTFAVLISALSATAWVSTSLADGFHFTNYFVPVWNALVKFTFYFVVVVLATKLRALQRELETRVHQRTAALNEESQTRARLQKELLETAEREQRRIGYDLHDGLGQHLTGMALAGQVLGQKLADKSSPETAEARRLVGLVEEAIELTRTLARDLHPVEIQAGQLADSFQELAARTGRQLKVSCQFESHLAAPLTDVNVATQLYRIAQEAVTNAVRHGKARHINICLDSTDDEIVLTVTDDGVGLSDTVRPGDGMGLRIMAYRAGMIGATFNIERLSALSGTRVTCMLAAGGGRLDSHVKKD